MLLSHICLLSMADTPKTQLFIWAKDGTKVAYALEDKPRLTFDDNSLIITAKGIEVKYPLENMARITYDGTLSIVDLQSGKSIFKVEGASLLFPSLKANSNISIRSLYGKLVFNRIIQASGDYSFSISDLNTGVYIVTVNGLSYKFVKK